MTSSLDDVLRPKLKIRYIDAYTHRGEFEHRVGFNQFLYRRSNRYEDRTRYHKKDCKPELLQKLAIFSDNDWKVSSFDSWTVLFRKKADAELCCLLFPLSKSYLRKSAKMDAQS